MAKYLVCVSDERHASYEIERAILEKAGAELKLCHCESAADIAAQCADADAVLHVDEETQGLSAAQIAASIGRAFSPQSVVAGFERAYRDAIATAAREHGIVGRRRG